MENIDEEGQSPVGFNPPPGVQVQNYLAPGVSVLDNLSKHSYQPSQDPMLRPALQIDPRFVDKNIHETLDRIHSFTLHQSRL